MRRPLILLVFISIFYSGLLVALAGAAEPSAFVAAARNGDTQAVHRMLQEDPALAGAADEQGYTALHWAGIRAHWSIVDELLKQGAPVGAVGADGGSPLHWICHHDRPAAAAAALAAGADLGLANRWGRTPLHVAARRGCLGTVRVLLEHGADPGARTKEGWTPLHVARMSGQDAVAALLLDQGADPQAKDKDGRTPAQVARRRPETWTQDDQDPDEFVGLYDLGDGSRMRVWWQDGSLRLREFADDAIYPTGRDSFFCRQEPWSVVFSRDAAGQVDSITVHFLRRAVSGGHLERPRYVGSEACRECHAAGENGAPYITWLKSRHGGAYWRLATGWARFLASLKPQYQDITDPICERRCLMCHHTAAQDPAALLTKAFSVTEGVGCETCHGPGSMYIDPEIMADRECFLAAGGLVPDADLCRRCHRNEGFDADEAMARLDHGRR